MSEIEVLEEDLRIGSRILEWEIGDIWGHVGVRLPKNDGVAVKLFRTPDDGDKDNWIVHKNRVEPTVARRMKAPAYYDSGLLLTVARESNM